MPELVELNQIRLDEDKTFEQLAAEVGVGNPTTLHRLLKTSRKPNDRTLHKIRRYLDDRRARAAAAATEGEGKAVSA